MKHVYTSFLTFTLLTLTTSLFAQGPNDSGEYYKDANGKKGADLKTALCAIIYPREEGGDLTTAYNAIWTHFKKTDVRPDGKVWDLYSSITNYDFDADKDPGNYIKDGDSKKKEGKYFNREHSWPNSWFGAKVMPMYTDLHHVYPTDKSVNEDRGNKPFGETNGSKNSAENFSKIGTCTYPGYTGTVFEPNDIYKGDLARTYFYMVTCYEEKLPDWFTNYGSKEGVAPTIDGSTYPGLTSWQLEMLMKWSKNDPVSADKEIPRNNEIYSNIQHNRNPFIDYPGLEEYIWGALKDVAFSYDHYQSPTAIMTIKAEPANKEGVMYNLAGQVVDKSYKGIIIMNGKKMIQK